MGALLQNVKKDDAGAEQAYCEAVRLDSQNAKAHNNLGALLQYVKKDDAGAVQAYCKAVRLDLQDAVAHNNLGALLQYVKKGHAGAEQAGNAGESDPILEPSCVPDSQAPACQQCQITFSLFRWRYHCRACGRVICSKCSQHWMRGVTLSSEFAGSDRVCTPGKTNHQAAANVLARLPAASSPASAAAWALSSMELTAAAAALMKMEGATAAAALAKMDPAAAADAPAAPCRPAAPRHASSAAPAPAQQGDNAILSNLSKPCQAFSDLLQPSRTFSKLVKPCQTLSSLVKPCRTLSKSND